ncbi:MULTISPECIES: AraC family transcriptional regulator [Paenibacillus]|uniref:AraC family transcriptional regulator n=1 Tax=Paenibacillus TaxID=44249 RepID=UPI00083926F2|nr:MULTISPECIES: AraC family transcriptional regulator [Paenibacillus]GIP22825.1 AraC family transcriptional regulator [Paenibacillus sp. J22TS3]
MRAEDEYQIQEVMLPDMESTFRIFAAHWRKVTEEWTYPHHTHPLFEINLLLEGSQKMTVNGKEYVQHPGDIMLLKPEDAHESRNGGPGAMTYYCIHFDSDERALRELLLRDERRDFTHDSPFARAIRPSLDKLISLALHEGEWKLQTKMITLSVVFELFGAITGCLSEQGSMAPANQRSSRIAKTIAASLERVVAERAEGEAALDEDTGETVQSVISGLGYSPSACSRMFQSVYGMSPRQYLSQLKLKKAKLLLMQPELSVEKISRLLGYGDIAHFSRQFKRWTGEPPGKFRARNHI